MAFYDHTKGRIVFFESQPYEGYPGWELVDCGCCNGLRWGGEEPIECSSCGGTGALALHKKSKALAQYPGGPFRGIM